MKKGGQKLELVTENLAWLESRGEEAKTFFLKKGTMPPAKLFAQTLLKFDTWCESTRGLNLTEEGEGIARSEIGSREAMSKEVASRKRGKNPYSLPVPIIPGCLFAILYIKSLGGDTEKNEHENNSDVDGRYSGDGSRHTGDGKC
jgi:hypothetical protein